MGYKGREIESKLLVFNRTLDEVNTILYKLLGDDVEKQLFGSSTDTYWQISNPDVAADFIRMRERDGIRQITTKGRDRGTNLDRLEIDVDSTSSVNDITKLLTSAHGRPAGQVGKTYYVYWLDRHTTVCCYSVIEPAGSVYPNIVVEVETVSMDKLLELETKVCTEFNRQDIRIERAPGSLYEMFITGLTK